MDVVRRGDSGLLAAVAAGGVLGSLGRDAVGLALPHVSGAFAWSTFLVNVTGSLAMGVLVVWVLSMARPHPWLRPFLGVGVLGWEAIGYANVVLEGTRSVPDGFRELAEKEL